MLSKIPRIPASLLDRKFVLHDSSIEITSLDIASNGCFLVAGSSSGLFDLTNPFAQRDGLLIGQIRARGMHTNLLLTVKFSEDSRFVFAGVSKGSSEMLAIDLGKLLVDWETVRDIGLLNASAAAGGDDHALQSILSANVVTFSFSDAKLRGFGAVVRTENVVNKDAADAALYRLACGKGIKNVHIWHFSLTTAASAASSGTSINADTDATVRTQTQPQMLHGKWEYVYDVASNGNTITHIEFRHSGRELLSKSAGMCIRVWDLKNTFSCTSTSSPSPSAVVTTTEDNTDASAASSAAVASTSDAVTSASGTDVDITATTTTTSTGAVGALIKPSYVDIANSHDAKCLLPYGTVAYGGTYEFAVLNTSAPREVNRDVLALPQRLFSGGAAGAIEGGGGGGGRRTTTREIEQVICTDEGTHALVLCADGGVLYYRAAQASTTQSVATMPTIQSQEEEEGPTTTATLSSCSVGLVELPTLSSNKTKEQQQQQLLGSWALRRVGLQGHVVSKLQIINVCIYQP